MCAAIVRPAVIALSLVIYAAAQIIPVGEGLGHLELGLFTDLYGDKVLIEFIDRGRYPAAQFPFQIGDELVSISGQPVGAIINAAASTPYQRRLAADALTYRTVKSCRKSAKQPADVIIRRAGTNALEFFALDWAFDCPQDDPLITYGTPPVDHLQSLEQRRLQDENGQWVDRNDLLGWNRSLPYFDLPRNFQARVGSGLAGQSYSGTFEASGKRIGYLRIPDPGMEWFWQRVNSEMASFNGIVDGLIVDVSRVASSGCPSRHASGCWLPQPQLAHPVLPRPCQKAPRKPALCTPAPVSPSFLESARTFTGPTIFLADELSFGSSETLLAIMQANARGPVVGMPTAGESNPNAVSISPDIQVNYMTRPNLLTRGQDFLNAITAAILSEIGKSGAVLR